MREIKQKNISVAVRQYAGTEPVLVIDDATGKVVHRIAGGSAATTTCPAKLRMVVGTKEELDAEVVKLK